MTHEKPESSSPSRTSEEQQVNGPWGVNWPESPKLVQMTLAVYIPGKGWLTTKRGIIYGGRHGEPPLIDFDVDVIVERLTPELRSGIRAMKHRLENEQQ